MTNLLLLKYLIVLLSADDAAKNHELVELACTMTSRLRYVHTGTGN